MQKFKLDLTHLGGVKFLLIILIVCIHASPSVKNNITYGTAPQIYVSQILSRIAVPLYFFISGYLMVLGLNTRKDWEIKIKKRLKTILLPYLIWNGLYGLLLFFLSYQFALKTSVDYNMTMLEQLKQIFISPVISPLWFLRDLLLFQIIALLYLYITKRFKYVVVLVLLVFWFYNFHIFNSTTSSEGALFFTIGFFKRLPFYTFFKKHFKLLIFLAVALSVLDLKIRYAEYWWSLIFHRITVLALCYSFVFFVTESYAVKRLLSNIKSMNNFSFYIFVLHFPLLYFINQYLDSNNSFQYVVKVLLAVLISIGIGCVLNLFPKISRILTGNRT